MAGTLSVLKKLYKNALFVRKIDLESSKCLIFGNTLAL